MLFSPLLKSFSTCHNRHFVIWLTLVCIISCGRGHSVKFVQQGGLSVLSGLVFLCPAVWSAICLPPPMTCVSIPALRVPLPECLRTKGKPLWIDVWELFQQFLGVIWPVKIVGCIWSCFSNYGTKVWDCNVCSHTHGQAIHWTPRCSLAVLLEYWLFLWLLVVWY